MTNTLKYYYGAEISERGQREGYVDQNALCAAMNGVMHCSIISDVTALGFEWEIENGSLYRYYDGDGNEYSYDEAQNRISELQDKIEELEDKISEIYEENEDSEEIGVLEQEIEQLKEEMNILEEPEEKEIYRTYIISDNAAETLCKDSSEELLFFCDVLNLYVWCVTQNGADWKNLLTDIPLQAY